MAKKSLVCLVLISILFSGCSKYGYVSLNYPRNPSVYLPDNIRNVAIVNRSRTNENDKKKQLIEAIITGEIAGSDRIASDECLKGVFDGINGYRGIDIVIPQIERLYGTGTNVTPELLNWQLVKKICDSTNADALLVLETFDSNSDLLLSTVTHNVNAIINGGTPSPALPSQVRITVNALWRLYDPANKTIVDQYQSTSHLTVNGAGNNLNVPPPEALPNAAYAAGQEYIQRFLPSYYTVRRDLYKRGKGSSKQEFKTAFRKTEVANWQGAMDEWIAILKHSSRKNAGRACLNMAVSFEVLGNTDSALEWAKNSYELYNNKLGRDYSKILLNRRNIEY